ncbi:LOW QUALITY PROTEIN: A49-like RNA polymerase I associated factor-domain-containing protein, partial [Jimgerdemannia flammicorona]
AFPGIEPPPTTVFKCYRHTDISKSKKARQRVIAGETDKVEFVGSNFGEQMTKGVYCRYIGFRQEVAVSVNGVVAKGVVKVESPMKLQCFGRELRLESSELHIPMPNEHSPNVHNQLRTHHARPHGSLIHGHLSTHPRYVLGVRSKSANTLTLKEAPVFALHRTVKALKSLSSAKSNPTEQFRVAKAALGEAFGTKKVKQQIKALERNVIDTSAMQDVAGIIQEQIEEKTNTLPSKEEIKLGTDSERPIPPYNLSAESAEEIYKLEDIISDGEMLVIPIKPLLDATNKEERRLPLPFRVSSFINDRLDLILTKPGKKSRKRIRMLMYLSYMMVFSTLNDKQLADRETVSKILLNAPSPIIDRFYDRFTEVVGGPGGKHKWTPVNKDRLLCYIFLLSLMIDQYSTDPAVLATDLSLKMTRTTELFKTLGCKVESLNPTQRAQLDLTTSEAKKMKRATLLAPLTFPAPRLFKKN